MKTIKKSITVGLGVVALSASVFVACNKGMDAPCNTGQRPPTMDTSSTARQVLTPVPSKCSSPYNIKLLNVVKNGSGSSATWTWTWSVKNPNPGNGKNNGTVQDLSHWNIVLNNCCGCGANSGASINDVVSASYSSNNGSSWTYFTPTVTADPSVSSYTSTPVLKFDYGTNGSTPTLYRLVLKRNFMYYDDAVSYYKSGSNTGIGEQCFPGIGCVDAVY